MEKRFVEVRVITRETGANVEPVKLVGVSRRGQSSMYARWSSNWVLEIFWQIDEQQNEPGYERSVEGKVLQPLRIMVLSRLVARG